MLPMPVGVSLAELKQVVTWDFLRASLFSDTASPEALEEHLGYEESLPH